MGVRIIIQRPGVRGGSEWSRRFVWGALTIAAAGLAYTLFSSQGLVAIYRERSQIEKLRAQVKEAEETNRALADEIRALQEDPLAIERIAREQLFLGQPDEVVYLLPPVAEPVPLPQHSTPPLRAGAALDRDAGDSRAPAERP